jgi:hypothetical protein
VIHEAVPNPKIIAGFSRKRHKIIPERVSGGWNGARLFFTIGRFLTGRGHVQGY